ncbi:MAG: hypothetical protein ACYCY9_09305 [Thiobacillus sp.]
MPMFLPSRHEFVASQHKPLGFVQPLARLSGVSVIEVSNHRACERLAERRHAVLPLFFPDHREALDVGVVFDAELEVLPGCTGVPAVKTGHVELHAQLPVLPNKPFNLWNKLLVMRFCQLSADMNGEQFSAVFFTELNGHFGFLWFDSAYENSKVRLPPRGMVSLRQA